jgi:hypothetical protein
MQAAILVTRVASEKAALAQMMIAACLLLVLEVARKKSLPEQMADFRSFALACRSRATREVKR